MKLSTAAKKFKQILCISIAAFMLCSGMFLGWAPSAVAGEKAADIAQSRASKALDRVAGDGTANELGGQVKEGIGKVQRQFGDASDEVTGATKQVTGKVQKDIGKTQGAIEDTADSAEDTAEGIVDSVKDFFGQ